MNAELKAMLKEVIDLVATGKALIAKDWGKVFACLVSDGQDVPAIVTNWADIKPELEKLLADPSCDADLLAYVVGLIGGADAKAKAIISSSADLVLTAVPKVVTLVKAIEA